jgi:Na+-driven multidrug efflux pump
MARFVAASEPSFGAACVADSVLQGLGKMSVVEVAAWGSSMVE